MYIYYTTELCISICLCVSIWCTFISTLKNHRSLAYLVNLWFICESLYFTLIFERYILSDIIFLFGCYLFLLHFECIMPLALTCKLSAEKSFDNLMGLPLEVMSQFYVVTLKILCFWVLTIGNISSRGFYWTHPS